MGGDRRSVENIAEAIDGCVVRSLQSFVTTAPWDADAVLAELRRQVAEEWGAPEAVVVVDETRFPKKGIKSCGVVVVAVRTGTAHPRCHSRACGARPPNLLRL